MLVYPTDAPALQLDLAQPSLFPVLRPMLRLAPELPLEVAPEAPRRTIPGLASRKRHLLVTSIERARPLAERYLKDGPALRWDVEAAQGVVVPVQEVVLVLALSKLIGHLVEESARQSGASGVRVEVLGDEGEVTIELSFEGPEDLDGDLSLLLEAEVAAAPLDRSAITMARAVAEPVGGKVTLVHHLDGGMTVRLTLPRVEA